MRIRIPSLHIGAALLLVAVSVSARPIDHVEIHPTALYVTAEGTRESTPALREATGVNTYLTSVAIAPADRARLLVATTFHGLYESADGGRTWSDLGDAGGMRALYLGSGFYEDISAAAYDTQDARIRWVELAQTGELVALNAAGTSRLDLDRERGQRAIAAARRSTLPEPPALDRARRARRELAADHISFYLAPNQTTPERLAGHMEFAREHGFTAVVIDFKDDQGRLAYDSQLADPRAAGAVRPVFDVERVMRTVHEAGLYLIARVVVFKDLTLYTYDRNRYALWDRRRNTAWGVFRDEVQVEHWVDPFSEWVWNYNIAIAEELQTLGVDEIQFDYIRTPADGRTWDIEYRYMADSPAMADDDPYADDRVEALSMFLERARERISIPIGIDVFGFNGWYQMSYLGQDIAALSRHVDVISPMLYPSHFPRTFVSELPYLDWAEFIYREGTARGRRITGDAVIIRPYVQAFLIGGELQFEEPYYTDYLKRQIDGAFAAGASGFTLWNFSGRYYMVARGLGLDE